MKRINLATKIFIGLILGVLVGLVVPADFAKSYIQPLGELFMRLIKMVIVPLIFSTLVVGASSVGDVKKLGRMGGKTVAYYISTTAIAIAIGMTLANMIQPGAGIQIPVDASYQATESPGIIAMILQIIPANPLEDLVKGNMLQIVVFALFVGVAITFVGKKAEPVRNFFEGFSEIVFVITNFVMALAPIGVFGLMVPVVAVHGLAVLAPMAKIILVVFLACFIHATFIYSAAIKFIGKASPIKFYKAMFPALLVAFSTCSSAAALPSTFRSVEDGLGVSKDVSSFVLSLGSTINSDGAAIYQGVAALFVAQVYGLDLTIAQQFTIVLTGTLASLGAAGVPGAALIMLTMVLSSVGLPLEGIALVAGVDRILDMARTTLNVAGDASAAMIVGNSENDPVPSANFSV
ncbi:dicarboxylate/amino acid:cation symporter [Desulfitobacterium hafniense]|uniref:dicarboxylate/amino acid:cation symporter n=1 Tax=Desulfitobacterium hafniense TaxID=49338 RepID=UPI00037AC328|nr:dicarboxylate/amino acid:cation symporter [Desulfitobacterium hafniense]